MINKPIPHTVHLLLEILYLPNSQLQITTLTVFVKWQLELLLTGIDYIVMIKIIMNEV